MAVCFMFIPTLLPNCQHCYFSLGNRVQHCYFSLGNKVNSNRVDKHGFLGSCIFVFTTAPSDIYHPLLRSVLRPFSLNRVSLVWISYLLHRIMLTELIFQNLNMMLEYLHSFVTLQSPFSQLGLHLPSKLTILCFSVFPSFNYSFWECRQYL